MGYDGAERFMPDLNPEQRAREQIDAQLLACGWVVQDSSAVDHALRWWTVGRRKAPRSAERLRQQPA
jgi:type I site-specific restriction endonuclease